MGFVFRLIGLPFAVIDGTISIAHEGIGIAVDSVAKKRRQRKALHRQTRQYPSSGHYPDCTEAESHKAPSYQPATLTQSRQYSTESSAELQGDSRHAPPSYSSLPSGFRTELQVHEPVHNSAELSAYQTSRSELDSYSFTPTPSELPSKRYSEAAKPDKPYVI